MNRRFLAIGLASALSLTAALSGVVPGALVGKDISSVSAARSYTGRVINISYDYLVEAGSDESSNVLAVGQTRAPIFEAYSYTTTTDFSNEIKYVDGTRPDSIYSTATYSRLAPNQVEWSSSDPTEVSVDANGVVTALAETTGSVTEYDEDGDPYTVYGVDTITARWKYTDEDGVERSKYGFATVRVQKTPYGEATIDETIDLNVGDVYTMPVAPAFKKGSTVKPDSVRYSVQDLGGTSLWDGARTVASGEVATFDTLAKTLTAKAVGTATVQIYCEDTNDNGYWCDYTFNINPKAGEVVADDYGKANYKILTAGKGVYEVAYAGMIQKTKKAVVPASVKINNQRYDVVEIADNAFKKADITSVRLPLGLRKIGASAFEGSKLTSLDISNTQVKELGAKALNNTKKLTELTINGDVTTKFGANAIGSLNKKVTVNVETSSNKVFKKVVKNLKNKKIGGKNAKKAKFVEI